jgi:hypothetical protein
VKTNKCVICSEGTYVDLKIKSATDLHNLGLGVTAIGSTAWRAVECDGCGNVQIFRIERTEEQLRSSRW